MDMAATPTVPDTTSHSAPLEGWSDGMHALPASHITRSAFITALEDLTNRAAEPNPFFEEWFLSASHPNLPEARKPELFAYIVAGELVGLAPLEHSTRYYGYPIPHFGTALHDNSFCGAPLIAAGHEVDFWRTLFTALDTRTGAALMLHLPMIPAGGAVGEALREALHEQDRASAIVDTYERAMLDSELSPNEYLEVSMSAKKRKELRRQHKRLSEEGQLSFERLEGDAGIAPWTQEFLSIERAGWKGAEGSALASAPETEQFFAETLAGAAHAGRLERLALRVDGRAVAMLANFLTPPGSYSFKTTFDERYRRYSPGLLLQLENLNLLNDELIEWTDSCAAEGHPMIERLWREKRTLHSYNIALGGKLRRALFTQLMRRETRKGKA